MENNKFTNENSVNEPSVHTGIRDPASGFPPSSTEAMDSALETLTSNKEKWARLDIDEKITILDEIAVDFQTVEQDWVDSGMRAKRHDPDSFGEGEEWFYIYFVYNLVRVLKNSLQDIKRDGRPKIPGGLSTLPNGQVAAHVFPQTFFDRLVLIGTTAEVIMQPGVTGEQVLQEQASYYKQENPPGVVTLVLGGGNAPFLVPGDFLYKLYVEGHVVALKMNPVNEYLGPLIERGFHSLVSRGFLQVLYGGAEQGAYLSSHPHVDELHMTGSHQTYEAIVFGTGDEGKRRKAENKAVNEKRFTAELGNITPVIVVPGDWTEKEVRTQALKIATWLVYNAGFACPAPRLVVQWENWHLRDALNRAISDVFDRVKSRAAYYPGSPQIQARFFAEHPEAELYGGKPEGHLPWTFIPGVDSSSTDDIVFNQEPFCSLISETAVSGETPADFLANAVSFLNENVWGSLAANIVVHPRTMRDPEMKSAVEGMVLDLRYGMVGVNQYMPISYLTGTTTWGSYPGNTREDIQSGTGVTNNFLMFAHPQKSVLWTPFSIPFDPFSAENKRAHEFGRKVAALRTGQSYWKLPGILWSILRG